MCLSDRAEGAQPRTRSSYSQDEQDDTPTGGPRPSARPPAVSTTLLMLSRKCQNKSLSIFDQKFNQSIIEDMTTIKRMNPDFKSSAETSEPAMAVNTKRLRCSNTSFVFH